MTVSASADLRLSDDEVARYLDRIAVDPDAVRTPDLSTLSLLMRAHLVAVPFETLDVFHQIPVRTDLDWSIAKIVDRRRGGWCFELNGAFGALLSSLGFPVRLLGAAVIVSGPNQVLDHLTLEVEVPAERGGTDAMLVDVGFGELFVEPLRLNDDGLQDGGDGWRYQLMASPIGTTLARELRDGSFEALYRFKRVAHRLDQFSAVSDALAADESGEFRTSLVLHRLGEDGSRIRLSRSGLKVTPIDGEPVEDPADGDAFAALTSEWFGIDLARLAPDDPPTTATAPSE